MATKRQQQARARQRHPQQAASAARHQQERNPRKTLLKSVASLTAELKEAGYEVVEKEGKYNIKKGTRARKFIAEGLTVAGLEAQLSELLGKADSKPDETNKAIAAEMDAKLKQQAAEKVVTIPSDKDIADQVLGAAEGNPPDVVQVLEDAGYQTETDVEKIKAALNPEGDDEEIPNFPEVNWDIGKGKAPMGDKRGNSAHTFFKGKNLYLVEARYAPDVWAIYVERANVASAVQGLEQAKHNAIDAVLRLAEAEASGNHQKAVEILNPPVEETGKGKKGKSKQTAAAVAHQEADEVEPPSPADNPNTDPRIAASLRQIFGVPREAELIGNAATPNDIVNAAIAKLEPLQVKGQLTLWHLLDALQHPTDTKRVDLALFLAKNGVEITFKPEGKIELRTVAPASSLEEPLSAEEELDLERFL